MNKKKYIGIIGGYGLGGRETAKALLDLSNDGILLGGRNLQKAEAVAYGLGPRVLADQVDIGNGRSLERFCRRCRLVINCAGPSRRILDTVALAALNTGIHYLDMGGDDILYGHLLPLHPIICEKGLSFIVSTGMYPGLSGLFPAYTADGYFDRVDSLTAYFVNQGDTLSHTAAYDVIRSMENDYARGMSGYKNGEIIRTGMAPVLVDLPFFKEKIAMYPSFTQELKLLAQSCNIQSIYNYIAPGEAVMKELFSIRANTRHMTEEELKKAVDSLVQASHRDTGGKKKRTLFYLVMEGEFRQTQRKIKSSLFFEGGSSRLMGIVAAAMAHLTLESYSRAGSYFMFDGVCRKEFMGVLSKFGIVPVESMEEQPQMDSGVIF
ncbi:MAG: saccharopine dehydrogenase NADP-binding domain-containing protein [Desulfobacterium sp.]|nr:saccharopine dehydrogenase NADP-binding domain-containing protein [Desulfobacterium sp.]